MLNEKLEIVYVGQTKNLQKRLLAHHVFTNTFENFSYEGCVLNEEAVREVKYIKFAVVPNKYWSDVYELTFISKFKPKFNYDLKYQSDTYLELPELTWYKFYSKNMYTWLRFCYYSISIDLDFPKDVIERSVIMTQFLINNRDKLNLTEDFNWYMGEV